MRHYRCRHDIIADILNKAIENPSRISHLAQAGNLPLDRAKPLIQDLTQHGLLIYNPENQTYEASELAYEWTALYNKLKEIYEITL
jgi:predicted transcriptional regulator